MLLTLKIHFWLHKAERKVAYYLLNYQFSGLENNRNCKELYEWYVPNNSLSVVRPMTRAPKNKIHIKTPRKSYRISRSYTKFQLEFEKTIIF